MWKYIGLGSSKLRKKLCVFKPENTKFFWGKNPQTLLLRTPKICVGDHEPFSHVVTFGSDKTNTTPTLSAGWNLQHFSFSFSFRWLSGQDSKMDDFFLECHCSFTSSTCLRRHGESILHLPKIVSIRWSCTDGCILPWLFCLFCQVQKRKKLRQRRERNGEEMFRPLRGFFSLRFEVAPEDRLKLLAVKLGVVPWIRKVVSLFKTGRFRTTR